MERRLLSIYLNDHLAVEVAGCELARRAASSNAGTQLGAWLEDLASQMDSDRRMTESLIRRLRLRPNPAKTAAAWLGEKAGRLKPNGRLRGYSPLSRVAELEALELFLQSKARYWRSVREILSASDLGDIDPDAPARRADERRLELEAHLFAATRTAFGTP